MKTRGLVLDARRYRTSVAPPDTLEDTSRFGNDGVHTNITWVRLPSGLWVRSFNGATSLVNCGSILSDWTGADWTQEAWASLLTGVPANAGIFSNRFGVGAANWVSVGWYTDSIRMEFGPAGVRHWESTGEDPRDAGWILYQLIKDGNIVTLYMDTVSECSYDITTAAHDLGDNTNDVYIGRWFGAAQTWNGHIALPKIYTYALSPAAIYAHYQAERRFFGR